MVVPFSLARPMNIVGCMLTVAVPLLASFCAAEAGAAVTEGLGSVAIASSANGEARVSHTTGTQQSDQPKFRGRSSTETISPQGRFQSRAARK